MKKVVGSFAGTMTATGPHTRHMAVYQATGYATAGMIVVTAAMKLTPLRHHPQVREVVVEATMRTTIHRRNHAAVFHIIGFVLAWMIVQLEATKMVITALRVVAQSLCRSVRCLRRRCHR